jgi:hypothetical protein
MHGHYNSNGYPLNYSYQLLGNGIGNDYAMHSNVDNTTRMSSNDWGSGHGAMNMQALQSNSVNNNHATNYSNVNNFNGGCEYTALNPLQSNTTNNNIMTSSGSSQLGNPTMATNQLLSNYVNACSTVAASSVVETAPINPSTSTAPGSVARCVMCWC